MTFVSAWGDKNMCKKCGRRSTGRGRLCTCSPPPVNYANVKYWNQQLLRLQRVRRLLRSGSACITTVTKAFGECWDLTASQHHDIARALLGNAAKEATTIIARLERDGVEIPAHVRPPQDLIDRALEARPTAPREAS